MTRKTRNLYNAVIRLIIQAYEARFPHAPITIVEVISDFELALMGAVPEFILRAEPRECWFHYGQAIIKKAGKLHLNTSYRSGGVVAHIIQEMIGIALLPPHKIYEGFEVAIYYYYFFFNTIYL